MLTPLRIRSGLSLTPLLILATLGCRSDEGFEVLRAQSGVFGVPNMDDDDGNGRRDFTQEGVQGDDDLSPLLLTGLADGMLNQDELVITLSGQTDDIRIWRDDQVLLTEDRREARFDVESVPAELQVEFRDFLTEGMLRIEQVTRRGEVVQEVELRLLASPMILSHHLQPSERSYVVEGVTSEAFFNNVSMVRDMESAIGNGLVNEPLPDFDFDVWVQDEFETATLTSPTSRIDVVIDSIRDRGLDPFPEQVVAAPGNTVVRTWGNRYPTSQDSFGNLEISPPVTVDGVSYPFGRIYWGDALDDGGLVRPLADVLEEQRVQDPFIVDTSWLCVGHVDEFTTFIPDPTAPKGFRLYVSDTLRGLNFVDSLDPNLELPRYRQGHGFATVGSMVDSVPLRALNEDLMEDFIEPAIDLFKAELGLTEADIVRVPGLFEEIPFCGPVTAALIPGTVNMLVVTEDDGSSTLILPDPFLRGDRDGQDVDPLIQEVNDLLPAASVPVWVDDWETYHLALGEVHCGTNATRTPTAQWWTDALHLIDGGDQ